MDNDVEDSLNAEPSQRARDPQSQREALRRSVLRANTTVAMILTAVLALAIVAVVAGMRAARDQQRAELAETRQREQLWQSYLEQARGTRRSGLAGSRLKALEAIRSAVAIRPSLDLRNEAIACLGMVDVEETVPPRGVVGDNRYFDIAPALDVYARLFRTGLVELLRVEDNKLVRTFRPEPPGWFSGLIATWVQFSPDGKHLGVGFLEGQILLWRVDDGQLLLMRTNPGPGRLIHPAFSPDGRWFAWHNPVLDGGGGRSFLELSTGQQVHLPNVMPYFASAIAPGRTVVALGSNSEVRLIDFTSGEVIGTLTQPGPVSRLQWSHQGRWLAVGASEGDVFLREVESDRFHLLRGHSEYVESLAFSSDDRLLLTSAQDRTTRLWDCEQGEALLRAPEVSGLRFGQDNQGIAFHRPEVGVGLWRLLQPRSIEALPLGGVGNEPNPAFDLSGDGRWLATLVSNGMQLHDLSSGRRSWFEPFEPAIYTNRLNSWSVTFHPSNRAVLLCQGGRLELWRFQTNAAAEVSGIASRERIALPSNAIPRQATLSADGRTVVAELMSRRLMVLDLQGERPPVRLQGQGRIFYWSQPGSPSSAGRFNVSPDGRWVVAGKDIGPRPGPTVWDAQTGRVVFSGDVLGLAGFTLDGKWLWGSTGNRYLRYRTEDWKVAQEYVHPALAGVAGFMAWPPDGPSVLVSHSRQALALLDEKTGEQQALFSLGERHSAAMFRWSHDGSRLVVASPKRFFFSWNIAALRRELADLKLDWGAPLPDEPASGSLATIPRARLDWLGTAGLCAAVMVSVVAVLALRRHRRLIADYARAEALALERAHQLVAERELGQLKSSFVSVVSHEFRTPLGVIVSSTDILRRYFDRLDKEMRREQLDIILRSTGTLSGLVEDLLLLGKVEAGKLACQPASLDLATLCRHLADEVLSATQHACPIELHLGDHLGDARGDEGLLRPALTNLLTNAVKYSTPGTPVELRVTRRNGRAEFVIRDRGIGIPELDRSRLFAAFSRGSNVGSRPGTGLGLVIARRCVELHGGHIEFQSAPGQGTVFTVHIPLFEPSLATDVTTLST